MHLRAPVLPAYPQFCGHVEEAAGAGEAALLALTAADRGLLVVVAHVRDCAAATRVVASVRRHCPGLTVVVRGAGPGGAERPAAQDRAQRGHEVVAPHELRRRGERVRAQQSSGRMQAVAGHRRGP